MIGIEIDTDKMPVIVIDGRNKFKLEDIALIMFYLKNGNYLSPLYEYMQGTLSKDKMKDLVLMVHSIELQQQEVLDNLTLEAAKTPIVPAIVEGTE